MSLQQSQDLLITAATNGDVEFLKNCVASNEPISYYLLLTYEYNFLYYAIKNNKLEFIKEAIKLLPVQTIQHLLLDKRSEFQYNLLHTVASFGNVEIMRVILELYKSQSSMLPLDQRPWLIEGSNGFNPCHLALSSRHEQCAIQLLKMDMELLCKSTNHEGWSLLLVALSMGFNDIAKEMLNSSFPLCCTTPDGYTALHFLVECLPDDEICTKLLEKDRHQIEQLPPNGSLTVLYYWAEHKKLWPFEYLLRKTNIIPNIGKIIADLMCITYFKNGFNPLHTLATSKTSSNENVVEIAKLLIENYKQQVPLSQLSSISDDMIPWLTKDKEGCTPLFHAINNKKEQFAVNILSADYNVLKKTPNALLFAIEKECNEVAEKILDIIDAKGWTDLLMNQQQTNALHYAPLCKKELFERLLNHPSELLEKADQDGATVLHAWVAMGKKWLFEYIYENDKFDKKKKNQISKLIYYHDIMLNTPFHYAASSTHEATYQIAKLLVEAYKEDNPTRNTFFIHFLPWFTQNNQFHGPMHLAMMYQREKLALYFLSLLDKPMSELLDYYNPKHKTLFLAIEYNCFQVAKEILTKLDKDIWSEYVTNYFDGQTIWHLAPYCRDKEFALWLVQEAPELITQKNNNGDTPLDEASDIGAKWMIEEMLDIDTLAFNKAPLAWIKACKNGHTSVIRAFIDKYPGKFSDHCIKHLDSPLHHIQLRNLTGYEEFLEIPYMKDLINVQDSQGATPLHKAIQNKNIMLTEALLNMDKIRYNIKDRLNRTAIDMLDQICKEQPNWANMCNNIGFDPKIKTTYFQHKTNLLDVRSTLSVVAALLATITFTAGFTLPGGFSQDNGEAILATKAAFLVFLISDTLAMCFSMLVLICLIWSMVYNSNKSLFLIDRSMMLLMLALYCTLLAFMTGVYIVISPKSLWAAILIIVMCSLIGISANRNLLYKVLDKFIPSANNDIGDPTHLLEMGKACLCGSARCLTCN